jgi:hypothetical protein
LHGPEQDSQPDGIRPGQGLRAFASVLSRPGLPRKLGDDQACELELEGYRFILQHFYVKDHAGNFMMSLMVEDADKWWEYIQATGLVKKYNLHMAKPPELQPWGLRVLYLTDPTGVLWHIADRPKS